MASKADILKELDFVTDKLSTQVRTTALGALVFAWGLLVGESSVARSVAGQLKWHLVGVGAVAILTMFLDFLQYLAGYTNALSAYRAMEAAKKTEGQFDENSFSYRLRKFFFYGKSLGLMVTVIWLLCTLGHWLIISYI